MVFESIMNLSVIECKPVKGQTKLYSTNCIPVWERRVMIVCIDRRAA
jgi:hypothetical protein